MQLWILGQVKSQDGSAWEIGGVFSTREKAIAACREWTDCVFSMTLDQLLPRETEAAPDCVYPLAGPA